MGTIYKAIKKAQQNLKTGHNTVNGFDTGTLSDPHGIEVSDNQIEVIDNTILTLSNGIDQFQSMKKSIPFPEEYQIKPL